MQFNFTLNNILRNTRSFMALVFFSFLLTGLANAQTYVNGNLSTGATLTGGGAAAPAGSTWSQLQGSNTGLGFGANITANLTLADDFTVPAGPSWSLSKVSFFAYSSGYAGVNSPFVDARVRIYNTDPAVGSPTPVWGNLTTNVLATSIFANMYRTAATADLSRRIWKIEANVNAVLPPGNYWIEWQLGNGGLSNFTPPSTVVGVPSPAGANSKQRNVTANTWTPITDAGGGGAQDQYFIINYATSACSGTPAPGNTIASAASVCPTNSSQLSLQNATSGSGVTYQWQSGPSATGPFTNITGATWDSYIATPTATTFYQAVVTCGASSGTSTPVQVAINPPSACYCIPAASNCNLDDRIANVTFGTTLNNNSACSANGYADYTSTVAATNIIGGATNPMRVTVGPGGTENVGVWIDYDKSGSFEASEFTFLGSGNGVTIAGNIVIPASAPLGQTRMRVRVRFSTAVTGTTACTTYTFGETEDYLVNIVPCVVSTVTTQPPATRTISCSGTGTITTTIAGSLNQYQWQVLATGAGAVWTDLTNNATYSGVTTNTLTITNALPNINGYQYRVRYQGACTSPSVTTATTLTVGALAPTVSNTLPINRCTTDAPTAISIASPVGLASLSTTASGTLHTNIPDDNDETANENDHFVSNNINVTNIPTGSTITGFNVKLNITHSWVGDLILVLKAPNGKIISLDYALSATGGAGATAGFTNTVISSTGTALLSTGTNPYTGTFRLDNVGPSTAGFTPTGPLGFDPNTTVLADMYQGNGTWTLALYDYYQDGLATNFLENWEMNITYTGLTTAVFTPATGLFTDAAGTIAYTGQSVNTVYANPTASTTYVATVNTAICGAGTVSIPVNVGSPISGTSTVANVAACIGGIATFSSTAPTGGLNATYQWQISTDAGVTWTNIAGATSANYTTSAVTATMNGNRYRVVRTVASCNSTLTSSAGTLTVSPNPVIVLSANPLTAIYPGQTTTLTAAVSPNAGQTYTWYRNGVIVPGATANTLVVDVDKLGTYTVTVIDVNGCSSSSSSITIKDAANDILFIYPSPNTGQFQVRYFSELGSTLFPRTVNVYDSKGTRVFTKAYSINAPYTRIDVDLKNQAKGIYTVELTDYNGNRIKTGRVIVL